MTPFLVADIGNSRIKWGWCDEHQVLKAASLPLDDAVAWEKQHLDWAIPPQARWTLASVNPAAAEHFAEWLATRPHAVHKLTDYRQLPLQLDVDHPEQVGIDRLLNAVAFKALHPSQAGVIASVGTAVTVDYVDEASVFCGGAIFPGWRLMAQALHQHTAKLPLVAVPEASRTAPAGDTESAIAAGLHSAILGGIRALAAIYAARAQNITLCCLTGGNAPLFAKDLPDWTHLPFMTLEGLRRVSLKSKLVRDE